MISTTWGAIWVHLGSVSCWGFGRWVMAKDSCCSCSRRVTQIVVSCGVIMSNSKRPIGKSRPGRLSSAAPKISTTNGPKQRGGRARPQDSRGERREALTKFYGVQACLALFRRRRHDIRRIFLVSEVVEHFEELLDWADQQGIRYKVGPYEELSRVAGTEHHEGICVEAKPLQSLDWNKLITRISAFTYGSILVLEGVENPHNIGAILRTACFFGVSAVVIVSKNTATLSGATCRVAEGAAEDLPVVFLGDIGEALTALSGAGFTLVATTPHQASSIYQLEWPAKVAIVFGAEGPGLSQYAMTECRERVVIPRIGPIESLNVGAAVASVLTEARRSLVVSGKIKLSS